VQLAFWLVGLGVLALTGKWSLGIPFLTLERVLLE
jgi:hypothetical protein